MSRSSLFLDSQRSHKKRKTSSESSSTTSTWSRYQSACIILLSWRILSLKTCPRSTASMVNLSTWTEKTQIFNDVFLPRQKWQQGRARSYGASFKLVAVCLRLSQFPLPRVPLVPINGKEDVGVGAGSIHVTRHHRHFVSVSCRGGDDLRRIVWYNLGYKSGFDAPRRRRGGAEDNRVQPNVPFTYSPGHLPPPPQSLSGFRHVTVSR